MTISFSGIGVAAGAKTAIGKAIILDSQRPEADPALIPITEIDAEIERLHASIRQAGKQLRGIKTQIPADTPDDILEFIDTHILMLDDKALSDTPCKLIRDEGCNAEWALHLHRNMMVRVFDEMEDPYLKTRKDDLNYVVNRVLDILQGKQQQNPDDFTGHIVIAQDLTPADAILLHHRGAAGFVTEHGSSMSHTAILARSMGIPAIVGAHSVTQSIPQGETLILDASNGILLADCGQEQITFFQRRLDAEQQHTEHLKTLRHQPARTRDGLQLSLMANIELADDVEAAHANAAHGIGLYRTEFLYMNRDLPPTEDEHFDAYRHVVEAMHGLPVTIRTLDLGADKQSSETRDDANFSNPALGLRAIRLCLKETDIFRVQIRGMLRASAYGQIRILIPMLTNLGEASETRQLIAMELEQLRESGLRLPDVVLGAMIETPAAAILADEFADYFDFLSIGTNDLVQYTLAVDRANDSVSHLYDSTHPAILKLISGIIAAGHKHDTPVSICGEIAADLQYLPLLLGMGLTEFSMQPGSLLEAKNLIRELQVDELRSMVIQLLKLSDRNQFTQQLNALIEN